MKKLFTLIMSALLTINIAQAATINVNISSSSGDVVIEDEIKSAGGWELRANSVEFYVFLSVYDDNLTELAGTYTAAQLAEYDSFVVNKSMGGQIGFTSGSITIAVASGDVTITGALGGDDGNTYNLNIVRNAPKVDKTVNIYLTGGYVYDLDGEVGISGEAEDHSQYVYLRLITDMEHLSGTFSGDEVDIVSSTIETDYDEALIYSATVNVANHGNGNYTVTADILCFNNTLYKVTLIIGDAQGLDDVNCTDVSRKVLHDGQIFILQGEHVYEAQGKIIQ